MVDRKPTYANRIKLTKVSDGSQELYTWEHADEPLTEGTPLSKANLLADDTASILGLSEENATPNGAIAKLAGSCSVTVTLPVSGWSESAPYTQTVGVEGMSADWVPGIPVLSMGSPVSVEDLQAAREALGFIGMITSAAGKLTFTAPEDKPGVALTLRVPGMVERS